MNMGFLSVPNVVRWLIFIAWIVTDQICWITLHLHLTGRWQKEEKMARGVGGGGDYSRKAINRGKAIIWGNTVTPAPNLFLTQHPLYESWRDKRKPSIISSGTQGNLPITSGDNSRNNRNQKWAINFFGKISQKLTFKTIFYISPKKIVLI